MDNVALNDTLQQLKELLRQQLFLSSEDFSEQSLEGIMELEASKKSIHQEITKLVSALSDASADRVLLSRELELLNTMNQQIQHNITLWYNGSSVEMKNIKNQRKTLQTYGGVAPGEVISYYIDFKK